MANETVKKILDIEVHGEKTVKDLKKEISELRDSLLNLDKGTEDYDKVVNKLIEDENLLTSTLSAGKKEVHAAEGSYNALQQRLTSLRRVWKEVTDEAKRDEIGKEINSINQQLKDLDASIGDYHRSVGDYKNSIVDASKIILSNLSLISPALGDIGKQVSALIPLITHTVQVATKGLKGIKLALASTGIGALIVALGLLVSNWEKVSDAIVRWFIPSMREANETTKAQVDANNDLIEANKNLSDEMEFQARVMQAQGATTLQVLQYKKKETEALLANTEAQIAETNAKIESLKAHTAWHRFWHGENKQIKQLEESLADLTGEQDRLAASLKKLGQDIVIENIVTIKRNSGSTDVIKETEEEEKKALQRLLEELEEYGKDSLQKINENYAERLALLQKYGEDTTMLTKQYHYQLLAYFDSIENTELKKRIQEEADVLAVGEQLITETNAEINAILSSDNEAFLQSLADTRNKEEKLLKERQDSYFTLAGSVQSIMRSVAGAWEDTIKAQVEAGEISEEEAEKQFEKIKAIQTAEAIINSIAGAVGAFMGITKDTGGWGIAAAVATAAAVLAAGMAEVAKIQSTTFGSKSTSDQFTAMGAVSTPQTVEYQPQYTQNITNETETENLANALSKQQIWVSVKDIDRAQNRVRVSENESTF